MRWACALACGFLIWVIPAAIDFFFYPILYPSLEMLLDTALIAVLFLLTTLFTVRYFKSVEINFLFEGITVGALWFLIAIAMGLLTAFVFPSSFQRIGTEVTPMTFFMSVGIFFLLVPVITIAFGYILGQKMLEVK